jgi:HEXXH motif-containing protein
MTAGEFCCSDLTVPDEGSQTVRMLWSRYLARQYRDFFRLRVAGAGSEAAALAILQRHCRALAANAPGPLFSALQHTNVGGMIRFLSDGAIESPQAERWTSQMAAALYVELALAGVPPPPIVLARAPARLVIASAGTSVTLPAGTSTVRLHPDGLTIVTARGATIVPWADVRGGASAYSECSRVPISGRSSFALADDSPLAQFETHPDKSGSGFDLGGQPIEDWIAALTGALALVRVAVPAIADEIELLIERIVPVGYDRERHLSASYAEFVGAVYLSLHPDVLTLAEALIHEHSHNKINMLWTLAPVLENGFTPLYSSPFRPDPRPLHGVLLGVHAFLPVERLYEQLVRVNHPAICRAGIEQRRRTVRERNAAACEMLLLHARPTATGHSVLNEIARWNAYYAEAVP